MKVTIYHTCYNAGDGSAHTVFALDKKVIEKAAKHDEEGYMDGDGLVIDEFEIIVDGEFNVEEQVKGITFMTMEEVEENIGENDED